MRLWNFRFLGWANGYSFLLTVFEHHVLRRKQQNGNCSSKMLTCGMEQSRWPATATRQVRAMPLTSALRTPHVPAFGNLLHLLLEPFWGGTVNMTQQNASWGETCFASLLLGRLVEEEPKTKYTNASVCNHFAVSFPVTQYQVLASDHFVQMKFRKGGEEQRSICV